MNLCRVDFSTIDWEEVQSGIRQKAFELNGRRIRLVEYTSAMIPHCCQKGHYGYILGGRFEVTFADRTEILETGDGVFIPDGKTGCHKARVLSEKVLAVFVEDLALPRLSFPTTI
jgi:ethanolamine utilization protein EutQ (cupin superfamily)